MDFIKQTSHPDSYVLWLKVDLILSNRVNSFGLGATAHAKPAINEKLFLEKITNVAAFG